MCWMVPSIRVCRLGLFLAIKHLSIESSVVDGWIIITPIPYRTKVWREKSLTNLANFTKLPNFIRQIIMKV